MRSIIGFAQFKRNQLALTVACDENASCIVLEPIVNTFEEVAKGGIRHTVQKAIGSGPSADRAALEVDHLVFFGTCPRSLLERCFFYLLSHVVLDPHSPSQILSSPPGLWFFKTFISPSKEGLEKVTIFGAAARPLVAAHRGLEPCSVRRAFAFLPAIISVFGLGFCELFVG